MRRLIIIICSLYCMVLANAQEDIKPNGFNTFYHPNGKLLSEGNMKDGKPEGYWKSYYTTGVLKSEGNRKNFQLDSIWIFYNSTGDTTSKINFLVGKKNGYCYTYFTDRTSPESIGRVRNKELYVNNKREGLSKYFYKSGELKQTISFSNNLEEGKSIEYAKDGRIITILGYRKGDIYERQKINRYNALNRKNGEWIEFYEALRIKIEANYKNGLLHGYYKEYNQSGRLRLTLLYQDGKLIETVKEIDRQVDIKERKNSEGLIVRGPYVDDLAVGIHNTFDASGKIVASSIYDDFGVLLSTGLIDKEGNRREGWKDFYSSGKLRAEGNYKNNAREGIWKFYYENSKLEQAGNYRNGKEHGEWKRYYANGEIHIEENFYQGREDGVYLEYFSDGSLLVEGEFLDGEREGEWVLEINDFKAVGSYITGLRDGKWKYFYDDGSILFEGSYIQGSADGKHKYYYSDGSIKEEQNFASGIPTKHWKKFDTEGTIIVTVTYEGGKEYRINGVKIDFPDDNTVIFK